MRSNLFWLSEEQWTRIEQHLPTDVRGKERVDGRRIISGIVHVLKSGCHWKDCPPEYGPYTTVYNRFARWAERGVGEGLFRAFARRSRATGMQMIDSTHVKAHRSASGGKGGAETGDRSLTRRAQYEDPRTVGCLRPSSFRPPDGRSGPRLPAGPAAAAAHQAGRQAAQRCRLRQRWAQAMARQARHRSRRAQPGQSPPTLRLRQERLQATPSYRERLLSPQGLPPRLHSLRQAGSKLPRLRLPRRRYRVVDLMSLSPS